MRNVIPTEARKSYSPSMKKSSPLQVRWCFTLFPNNCNVHCWKMDYDVDDDDGGGGGDDDDDDDDVDDDDELSLLLVLFMFIIIVNLIMLSNLNQHDRILCSGRPLSSMTSTCWQL